MRFNLFWLRLTLIAILQFPITVSAALEWQSIGPDGGDLFGLEVSPNNPDTFFALSYLGVFRSTDAGANWEGVHNEEMKVGTIALAFDQGTPDHLFASTLNKGLWESINGGDTWTSCSDGLPTHPDSRQFYYPVASVVTLANNSVFVGVTQIEGQPDPAAWIYRMDSACNWVADDSGLVFNAPAFTQPLTAILSVDHIDQLWATVYGAGVYLYQASIWVPANGDLPLDALRSTYLAHDPGDSNRLLLGTEMNWIYETTDAGQTWSAAPLADDLVGLTTLPLTYNIEIDPNNPQFIYTLTLDASTAGETPLFSASLDQAEGMGGYLSSDGGASWPKKTIPFLRLLIDASTTVETNLPLLGTVLRSQNWLATSFGFKNLLKSTDGANSFEVSNSGIASLVTNRVWVHPLPPPPAQRRLFVAAEAGLSQRIDAGPNWDRQQATDRALFNWSFAQDPLDLNALLYSTGHPARLFTADRGVYRGDLNCFGESCPLATQILSDTGVWRVITTPLLPTTIYAATQDEGILVSSDQGASWSSFNAGMTLPLSVTDLALDELGTPLLAAARTDNGDITADPPQRWEPYIGELGGIYRHNGDAWAKAVEIPAAVYTLATDPTNTQRLLAASAEGVYETLDQGQSWALIFADTLIKDVLIDGATGYAYAATSEGVFRTTDGGIQWNDFSEGLSARIVGILALDPDSGTLYAGTLGGSVFELVADPSPIPTVGVEPNNLDFGIVPLGFSEELTARILNQGEAPLTISGINSSNSQFSPVALTLPVTLTPGGYVDLLLEFSPDTLQATNADLTIQSDDSQFPNFLMPMSGQGRTAIVPTPDVKLNDSDAVITVASGIQINVSGALQTGDYTNSTGELWVRHERPNGTMAWLVNESGWVESEIPLPFLTYSLFDVDPYFSAPLLANVTGINNIIFAVDTSIDGLYDDSWSDTITFNVDPTQPGLLVSPTNLNFDQVPVDLTGDTLLLISNFGETNLVVNAITLDAPEFFLVDPPSFPMTVNFGETIPITVRFAPLALGVINAQLSIDSNDTMNPTSVHSVSGEGRAAISPTPEVKLDGADGPLAVANGTQLNIIGALQSNDFIGLPGEFWLRHTRPNGTTAWLVNDAGWVESATPLLFLSNTLVDLDPYFNLPMTANSTGINSITFAVGAGAIGVFDDALIDTATFTVAAVPPNLLASPSQVDFDLVPVGMTKDRAFAISNTGESDLIIDSISANATEVSVTDPSSFPLTIASGTSTLITLQFAPQVAGVINAQLNISSNDLINPTTLYPVSGEGRAAISPFPDLKLDGSDGPVVVVNGGYLNLTAALTAGDYPGTQADFWIRDVRADGRTFWLHGTEWIESATPQRLIVGGIADINSLLSLYIFPMSEGINTITFAVDNNTDGIFDGSWSDSVEYQVQTPLAPLCDVETNQASYIDGDQLVLQTLEYLNPNSGGNQLTNNRLRLQISLETAFTSDIIDAGPLVLHGGYAINIGPVDFFTVYSGLPRGTWSFRCALENIITGDVLAEDQAFFEIQ